MATAKGSVKQRSNDSYTIIAPAGRDPESGRYKQTWQTVKRLPGETDAKLKSRAERELRKLLTKIDEGQLVETGRLTVADYVTREWLPAVRLRISKRTAIGYASIMERYVLPVIGNRQLRNLHASDIEHVYRRMAEMGLSGTTRLHCHRVLYLALKAAKRKRKLAHNPCEDIDAPRKDTRVIQPPTPEEVARLIEAAADTRIGVLAKLLAYTGLRLGEALGLRWQDVDLDASVLHVRQVRKHGGKEEFGEPKTERSRRFVHLAPELVNSLREHRSRQLAFNLEHGLFPAHALVFTFLRDGKIGGLDHNRVSHEWSAIRKKAGVMRARIHDLRHFAATTMIAARVPLPDVSAMLGHGQTSTTANIYAHVVPGSGRAAAAEIEKALAGK
jgi:integrase